MPGPHDSKVKYVMPTRSSLSELMAIVEHHDDNQCDESAAYGLLAQISAKMPREIREQLIEFRYGSDHVALVIKGAPLGQTELLPSPLNARENPRTVRGFQALCLGVIGNIATPFAYRTQQAGRVINNISPNELARGFTNVGTGFDEPFLLHTEDAFMDRPPSYLQLSCIRNPTRTPTILSGFPLDIPSEVLELLREGVFQIATNAGQEDWGTGHLGPVVYGAVDRPHLRFNPPTTTSPGSDSTRYLYAVQRLYEILKKNMIEVVSEPGDILIIDNQRTCHARPLFASKLDGTDRWLQRIVGYRDMSSVAEYTDFVGYPIIGLK